MSYSFWDTVAGQRFVNHTVPELIRELHELNEKLEVIMKDSETKSEEDNIRIEGIESEEKDLVVAHYNEVINQIGGNENE